MYLGINSFKDNFVDQFTIVYLVECQVKSIEKSVEELKLNDGCRVIIFASR